MNRFKAIEHCSKCNREITVMCESPEITPDDKLVCIACVIEERDMYKNDYLAARSICGFNRKGKEDESIANFVDKMYGKIEALVKKVKYYKEAWKRAEKENDELKDIIEKLKPAAVLQALREGNFTTIPLSIIGFNHWLATLPDDDFSEAFERATPVRWDESTQTWIEGEE